MKRFLSVIILLLFLAGSCAAAEILLPSYDSYVDQAPELISEAENADTVSCQYYTDADSISSYQEMLLARGFLLSGRWKLPGGDQFDHLDVYAYTWIGSDPPAAFRMTVEDDSFSMHILIQAATLNDGRIVLGITRSAGIGTYEFVKPTPTPKPTPKPDFTPVSLGICTHCNQGRCRNCNGTGQQICAICGGSGVCPTCNGKRRYYISGYGVGSGSYVDCQGCYGSGKCWRCNGSRKEDCIYCDGGICPYCHGNYQNP